MVCRRDRDDGDEGLSAIFLVDCRSRVLTGFRNSQGRPSLVLRFAYSTINWGTTPDLDAVFNEIRGAGWGAVELFVHSLDWLGTEDRLRDKLGSLQVATNFGVVEVPTNADQLTKLKNQIDYAALFGAEAIGLVGGSRLRWRPPSEAEYADLAHFCEELAIYGADKGVAVAYHPHVACTIETEDEIDRLMDQTKVSDALPRRLAYRSGGRGPDRAYPQIPRTHQLHPLEGLGARQIRRNGTRHGRDRLRRDLQRIDRQRVRRLGGCRAKPQRRLAVRERAGERRVRDRSGLFPRIGRRAMTISLAIAGCGVMGRRHVLGLKKLKDIDRLRFDLVAVCDPFETNAVKMADLAEEFWGRGPPFIADPSELPPDVAGAGHHHLARSARADRH